MGMKIGIIGYGYIGRALVERVQNSAGRFELAFIHNRNSAVLADIEPSLQLDDLANVAETAPDLIVECAHPSFTQNYGETFLKCANYMPLSVTALADDGLRDRLEQTALENGTKLYLPAGALIGGEALLMRGDEWQRVRITFRKHPDNIDFSESEYDPAQINGETVVYEGPVRGIAHQYPRNVNTMVTCALVSTGLDACEARLIADPALDCAIAEVEAWSKDGSIIRTEKSAPMVGVSGTEMIDSAWTSIQRASGGLMGANELV
ncbi:MAG: DUF108 domain-containing protein [Rhodospirillaceae bacterium]|nr:DUF108 domain-containing protein [Rhodospirillaceae bacterium]